MQQSDYYHISLADLNELCETAVTLKKNLLFQEDDSAKIQHAYNVAKSKFLYIDEFKISAAAAEADGYTKTKSIMPHKSSPENYYHMHVNELNFIADVASKFTIDYLSDVRDDRLINIARDKYSHIPEISRLVRKLS